MRLDVFLSQRFSLSREKSAALIKGGKVKMEGKILNKASFQVDGLEDFIELCELPRFVSRAGEKLYGFLQGWDLSGWCVLDVGASMGGFSQVALLLGAKEVHCVDVGRNQLSEVLRKDTRIEVYEECDIRDFLPRDGREGYDLLLCDLSFIGIEKIFFALSKWSKNMVLLFKPQFEVGRNVKRNKKGVVCDQDAIMKALGDFRTYVDLQGYEIIREQKSILKGKAGNEEFFLFLQRRD
ncbi:23S rRNA (cytidine-2'-O)-methyltransferase TlyA [Helicobacter mustelae]|uniref:Putative haemolysin n=1 Tax=Helicobacter mustelae (strain ATCC 43772 / CCUG 25715 / CIP 103759 / LMG 18044 / NCTC 12198 / R85-136P) TaxID=679897 RepID=D3UH57_HELM1|nr:TlyA family RNA methyltransferase [Helicobacter mustelae]CBG39829.1 putative haemolysin [Helicobacter mustelae 12198]SQH71339.1 hemolysin [Helicobacter mustelae]